MKSISSFERLNKNARISWRRSGALTLQALREANLLKQAVVVLFGSYARNAYTWRSDVDILVLLDDSRKPKLEVPPYVHLHYFSKLLIDFTLFAPRFDDALNLSLRAWA